MAAEGSHEGDSPPTKRPKQEITEEQAVEVLAATAAMAVAGEAGRKLHEQLERGVGVASAGNGSFGDVAQNGNGGAVDAAAAAKDAAARAAAAAAAASDALASLASVSLPSGMTLGGNLDGVGMPGTGNDAGADAAAAAALQPRLQDLLSESLWRRVILCCRLFCCLCDGCCWSYCC